MHEIVNWGKKKNKYMKSHSKRIESDKTTSIYNVSTRVLSKK